MSWKDRVEALWAVSDRAFPLDFHIGWIGRESNGNNKDISKSDEVGWHQIAKGERGALGVDRQAILDNEEVSFRAGNELMSRNDAKTPEQFTGTARLWLVKAWHTLPTLASAVIRGLGTEGGDDWHELSAWAKTNIDAAQLTGKDGVKHDPARWIRLTDDVMTHVSGESSIVSPITETIDDAVDAVADTVGTENTDMVKLGLGILVLLAGGIIVLVVMI